MNSKNPPPTRCPVCRARFRGHATCSRCGADLTPLMTLLAHGWRLRQAARKALLMGDLARATTFIQAAIAIHATPQAQRLLRLILCLAHHAHPRTMKTQKAPA